ncbi:hypothetical protein AB0L00_40965 [Actinoallomurus sp. NPDC052308]|uniref:hypothetical protein n=1 Tax=Actinoallomurus sp. NPDC052308 TaxID=3155530 RepID=UPI00341A66D4
MDLAYDELPADVEIVENAQGALRRRARSETSGWGSVPGTTPELARVACLTYFYVRVAMDRVGAALPRFEPPDHDAETIVMGSLAERRRSGLLVEERRQRQDFEKDLVRLPGFYSHGLTREQYERE